MSKKKKKKRELAKRNMMIMPLHTSLFEKHYNYLVLTKKSFEMTKEVSVLRRDTRVSTTV